MTPRRLYMAAALGLLACTTDTAVGPRDIASLTVFPDTVSLVVGDTVGLQVVAVDSRGLRYIGTPAQWSSSAPAVATVTASGAVAGLAVGSSMITAASRGYSATAQVTVLPTPVIATSADTVTFTAPAHGPLPAPQTVIVTNGNPGMLDSIGSAVLYTSGDTGWLGVTHSGTAAPPPDTITLTITSTTFSAGVYEARLLVHARRATNTPDTIVTRLVLAAGAPTQVTADSGAGQSATVNSAVAVQPTVLVRDQYGNPVAGVPVSFTAGANGGVITGATDTTDATGRARVGSWQLGTATGVDTLIALAAPLPGTPVVFTATATPDVPGLITKTAGDAQTATVGTAVATAPAVRVQDQFGNAVPGATVSFTPTAGSGSVTGGNTTTDASGAAAVAGWTLGTVAGTDTLVATAGAVSARFTATGTAAAAAQIAADAGTGQSATVNTSVAVAPRVKVSDQFGNGVAGVVVTFTITSSGGSLTAPVDTSDAAGLAAVGSWTLGTVAKVDSLHASAGSLTGSPVTFTATATAGPPASLVKSAGDGQSAPVATAVPVAPTVVVQDIFNNPVPGVAVSFSVTPGNGTLTGAAAMTDAAGTAAVGSWILGTTAKVDTLTASSGALPTVTFTATATAGGAANLTQISAASRTDTIGASFADTVKVTDSQGNPVTGVGVTWAIGDAGTLTPGGATTDANGIATAIRTLGTIAGTATDTAKATGLTGSPVLFGATTTSGHATTLALSSGDAQTDTVGHTLSVPYAVLATDRGANPVQNVAVTWAVTGGGSVSATSTTTGANGIASTSRTLGTTAGNQGATATAAGLSGSPVSFTATATNDQPTTVAVSAGDNQSATVGTTVPVPPAVVATDQFGNPVADVIVTFSTTPRSGSVTNPVDTTDASGVATVGSWTLGTTAGPDTLTATSSPTLSGSPVSFIATGISGSATSMAVAGGNNQTDTVLATLPVPYSVLVTDGASNPVSGVTVSWAVTSGGGSITPSASQTDASGIAQATRVLGNGAGTQEATASVGGLAGSPVTFTATANAGNPAQLAIQAGDGQSATVNTTVAVAPVASVQDAYGNPVSNVGVTFTITAGGGAINGGGGPVTVTTAVDGTAALASWQLGTAAGSNTLSASLGTLTPVTFTATGTADVPASITVSSGNGQSATVGTAVTIDPQVSVTDPYGNPVPSAMVTFNVTAGGGQVNGSTSAMVATGPAGLASVTWMLGTTAGTNGMSAGVGALTPVSFTATGTAAAANTLALVGGNNQTDTIGTTLPVPYTVSATDQYGNAVSGVSVTFTITAGGGAIDGGAGPVAKATGTNGQTSVTRTLGTTAGTQTVQASASVPSGSPVSFNAVATAGQATTMTANSATVLAGTVNTTVSPAPSVQVTDRAGNGVQGVAVTFAPASGTSGSVTGGSPTTGGTGVASVGSWTLDQTVGNDTVFATSSGLTGSPVRFVATSSAGPVSLSTSTLGASNGSITACSTSCTTGSGTASTLTVTLRDQFSNPVGGRTVTPSCSAGTSCAFNPSSGVTSGAGVFTSTFSSTRAEAKTVQAAVGGTGTLAQTAGVTVNPDLTTLLGSSAVAATSPITASSGGSPSSVTVTVRDQFNNAVSGRTVTIAVNGTGNTITQPASPTNGSGIATGSFSSTAAQTKTVSASFTGTGGGTIGSTASVTVNAAGASSIAVNGGNNQTARVGTAVATAPSVVVRDAFSNPVPGVTVTFGVTSGGGGLTTATPSTNASGIATVGSWTLGGTSADAANGTMANALSASASGAGSTSFSASAIYVLSGDVQPFLTTTCALSGCHVSGGVAPNLSSGSTYGSTVNITAICNASYSRVAPGSATNSVLYRRISNDGICSYMPPGATTGQSASVQKIIRAWINNGAQNN